MLPHPIVEYLHLTLPGTAMGLLLYAVLYPLRRRRLAGKGLESPAAREWLLLLLFTYGGLMAMLTMTPPYFNLFEALQGRRYLPFFYTGEVNLKPFFSFQFGWGMIVGNVLLFAPFPFAAATLWRGWKWVHALALAVGITVFIEVWQHFIGRLSDVDDLMLNITGGMLGWLAWLLCGRPALYCEDK